jgi:hypothetical protein
MHRHVLLVLILGATLSGCSSGGGVSTASILGEAPTPPATAGAAPAAPGPPVVAAVPAATLSDPTGRAFQAGSVTARAVKCGYNFDAAKLRASYIAYEAARGSPEEVARLEKIYDVAYSGVAKAAADEPDYCSERKTEQIKADLNKLLAGNFDTPGKAVAAAQKKDEGGLFSGWFESTGEDSGPSFGSDDWWAKQAEKSGK